MRAHLATQQLFLESVTSNPESVSRTVVIWNLESSHPRHNPIQAMLLTLTLVSLVLALLVTGFYWKLVLTDQYTYLESSDLARQWLPWMTFQAYEWHAGRVALWDPNLWMGQPLLAQAQPGAANPLHWILFSLPFGT